MKQIYTIPLILLWIPVFSQTDSESIRDAIDQPEQKREISLFKNYLVRNLAPVVQGENFRFRGHFR